MEEVKKQKFSPDDIRRAKIGDDEEPEPLSYAGRILFVSNLNFDCRPCDLRDLFQPKGKLWRVDIERDRNGEPNGLAFLEFASPADCEIATDLNGTQFMGRNIKCRIADNPPPELTRFYIRPLENRPISDKVKQRIIQEAYNGPIETGPAPHREHRPTGYRKRRNSYSDYSYSDYSYSGYSDYDYSSSSESDRGDKKHSKKSKDKSKDKKSHKH